MEIGLLSLTSKFIIFFGLYFTIVWLLILLNIHVNNKKIKIKKWPDVTILIPAFNEESGIEKTIKSCLNLSYKGNLEILVVDDGSKDNTVKIAKKYEKKINILALKKNGGKANALNKGLKKIKSEFFAVIDADCKFGKNTVTKAIKDFYLNDTKEQKVGAVMCKMKPSNENQNLLERIQLIEYMMVGLMRFLSANLRLLHMTNGGSFYRTKVVKDLKGFDKHNLTEDFEMGLHVRSSGHLVVYSRESKIFTKTPNKFKIFLKQRIRWSRGFIQTHKKYKKLFFNKKYGLLGTYQMPMNILGPIVYLVAIITISIKIYTKLYEFFYKLINTPDLIEWLSFTSFNEFMLGLDPKIDFLILMSFIILMFLYYGVIRFYEYNYFKENTFKKIIAFIIYIMFYNYIYVYVWYVSLKNEMFGAKYDWGTK